MKLILKVFGIFLIWAGVAQIEGMPALLIALGLVFIIGTLNAKE